MVIVDIVDNPNCAPVDLRVFHDLAPAQPVTQVRLERQAGVPEWYALTGWTAAGHPCPARIQKVDDSGDGTALLVYGGDAGLRLQPAASSNPWALADPEQWGEPFLIIADAQDMRGIA